MARNDDPPGQSWSSFLRNHGPHVAAMDLFAVPVIGFVHLYVLVIVRLTRRELVWVDVTRHPTAEWIAQENAEAFPWGESPHYRIRDQDRIYGAAVRRRLRAMGVRDKPIALGSPWQNDWHVPGMQVSRSTRADTYSGRRVFAFIPQVKR